MTINTLTKVCEVLISVGTDTGDEVLNKRVAARLPKYLKKVIKMTDDALGRINSGEEELSE